jgi:hypothetical protein
MDYSKVIKTVDYLTDKISDAIKGENLADNNGNG